MASPLAVINAALLIILICIVFSVILLDRQVWAQIEGISKLAKVADIKKSDEVVDETYRPLYREQTYNFRLEDFFLDDVYKKMTDDVRPETVQSDYFALFVAAIDTVLKYKKEFIDSFLLLDDPSSLANDRYIPCVKFAKYTVDYDKYLQTVNSNHLLIQTELKYPKFETDPKYYIVLDNGKCRKHVHVLKVLQKAVNLYYNHKVDVDECLYHNRCHKPVPKKPQDICTGV